MAKNLKAQTRMLLKKAQKEEKQRQFSLKKELSNIKGNSFEDNFLCDICKTRHIYGYLLVKNDVEYKVCKFCHNSMHKPFHKITIITTPMGNKR